MHNQEIVSTFNALSAGLKIEVLNRYIPKLMNSIKVDADINLLANPKEFIYNWGTHTGGSRSGTSWSSRAHRWSTDGCMWLHLNAKCEYEAVQSCVNIPTQYLLPIFNTWFVQALRAVTTTTKPTPKVEGTPTMKTVKATTTTLVDQHKEAAKLSAKLSVGRTANEFVMNKLAKMFPWYKRRAIKKNAMLKVLTAEVVNAVAQHLGNPKIAMLGDAMLQEAFVEGTVYSSVLTDIIKSLESSIDLSALEKLAK